MGTLTEILEDVGFEDVIQAAGEGGWIQIIFPFFLVYAIVFASSNKIEILEGRKGVRVFISLIIAFFAVTFPVGTHNCDSPLSDVNFIDSDYNFSSKGCTVGDYMSMLFPGISIFAIAILGFYIVCGLLGFDLTKWVGGNSKNTTLLKIVGGIGILIVAMYFLQAFGFIENSDDDTFGFLWKSNCTGDDCGILKDPLLWMIIIFFIFFKYVSDEGAYIWVENTSSGERKKWAKDKDIEEGWKEVRS